MSLLLSCVYEASACDLSRLCVVLRRYVSVRTELISEMADHLKSFSSVQTNCACQIEQVMGLDVL